MKNLFPYVSLRPHADGTNHPRFNPGQKQRALGFEPRDLKHDDGRWFNLEETAIFAAAEYAKIKAAAEAGVRVQAEPRKARKSVADLIDGFLASYDGRQKAARTQMMYGYFAEWLKFVPQSKYDRRNGVGRVAHPFSLVPASIVTKRDVKAVHEELLARRGVGTARNAIMFLSGCYKWAATAEGWDDIGERNPCLQLKLTRSPPRVKTWPVAAIKAVLATADAEGLHSVGDAMMLALYSAQRQGDVLALVDRAGRSSIATRAAQGRTLRFTQEKTGAKVAVIAAPDLVARLAAAEKRRGGFKVVPIRGEVPVVVNEKTGAAWNKDAFSHVFAKLVDRAALRYPDVEFDDLTFQDFRDTAITWLSDAGCSNAEIASYSGHKLATIAQILEHYVDINEDTARRAGAKQAAWLAEKGVRFSE